MKVILEAWVRVSQEVFSTSLFNPKIRKSLEWLFIKFKILSTKVFPILHDPTSPPPQLLYAARVLATPVFFLLSCKHANIIPTVGCSHVTVPLLAPLNPGSSDDSFLFLIIIEVPLQDLCPQCAS